MIVRLERDIVIPVERYTPFVEALLAFGPDHTASLAAAHPDHFTLIRGGGRK